MSYGVFPHKGVHEITSHLGVKFPKNANFGNRSFVLCGQGSSLLWTLALRPFADANRHFQAKLAKYDKKLQLQYNTTFGHIFGTNGSS